MRSRSWLPHRLLLALVAFAVAGVPSAVGGARLCSEPLDISGTTQLPATVTDLKRRDDIAYPAHTLLASLLERLGCYPTAIGVQWFKAAGHARSDTELERAVHGLAAVRQRGQFDEELEAVLCAAHPHSPISWQQVYAVAAVGLRCDVPPFTSP